MATKPGGPMAWEPWHPVLQTFRQEWQLFGSDSDLIDLP